jgi:hypothetical protein
VPPSTQPYLPTEAKTAADAPLWLVSPVLPGAAEEGTDDADRRAGLRRFYVPVAHPDDAPAPLRAPGEPETRPEPVVEVARTLALTVNGVTVPLPAYESLGRNAPRREWAPADWPEWGPGVRDRLPRPVLPGAWAGFADLYDATWEMLFARVRTPRPDSGLPDGYVSTGPGFPTLQFVWDSSFTAICLAYGHGAGVPVHGTLDLLYSRQFDGGYLHREHDVRDGMPTLYEPDFSPNPPILSVAEWHLASLTGDALRLRRVFRALADQHEWLRANRRLPDGTYWTTGLANGLDNSPSLGDGYPDLTAQMAHDAEVLSRIAALTGDSAAAEAFDAHRAAIAEALNARLWDGRQEIYSTSLPGGGHNPNKVVTAFWPLWAGVVPPGRVQSLARHAMDPASFWRHHPLPSLAADSPEFVPGGDYWRGSVWAPTSYASIKGFARADRWDVARAATERHLTVLHEVWRETGRLWENYSSEAPSRPGSTSQPDYCWTALGPIALLLEVLLGFEPDALNDTLRWRLPALPPDAGPVGVRNYPLGGGKVSVVRGRDGAITVDSDRPLTLEVTPAAWSSATAHRCPPGRTRIEPA